jgi:hypothetical protein
MSTFAQRAMKAIRLSMGDRLLYREALFRRGNVAVPVLTDLIRSYLIVCA